MKSIFLLLASSAIITVKSATISDFQTNYFLTSIEKLLDNSEEVLPKIKKVKVEVEQLSSDIENLKYLKTIDEVIAEDIKVIESNSFETELTAIESLKRNQSIEEIIEEIIEEDLKIIENNVLSNSKN